jgi:WD40 repeat protein
MYVLEAGGYVKQLRFFPDGRRLLASVVDRTGTVRFDVWTLTDGQRMRLPQPQPAGPPGTSYWDGEAVAVHPSGEWGWVSLRGDLVCFRTSDGATLPAPDGVKADQVLLSPQGDWLLAAHSSNGRHQLTALAAADTTACHVRWQRVASRFFHLAGFLPDGDRFVTIDDRVRVRTFATDQEQASVRYPANHVNKPQVSPDGRHLGVIGYVSMYVFDLPALGKPRRITSSSTNGDFVSFAFHPEGRIMAVIHGGPTLVKLYDLETMRKVHVFKWKLGPLECVAFSPDGMLGAAGSREGRIVVWDVD